MQLLAEHSSNFKSGLDPDCAAMSALLAPAGMRPFQISSPRCIISCMQEVPSNARPMCVHMCIEASTWT